MVPEEAWFGQPKYISETFIITPLRCNGSCLKKFRSYKIGRSLFFNDHIQESIPDF